MLIHSVERFNTFSEFQKRDAFIGYCDDTPAVVVFQASHQLQRLTQNQNLHSPEWVILKEIGVVNEELTPARLLSDKDDPNVWTEVVRMQFVDSTLIMHAFLRC